jgi:anti-sigma-K factor RskA
MPRDLNLTDVHALAGAYALNALSELERAAFGRHLTACESCALEVAELQEAASRLTAETAAPVPPGMRDAVLAEIARTPQERARRTDAAPRASVNRWRRWTAVAVAAGIVAVGAAVATWAVDQDRVRAARTEAQRVTDLLAAPDAQVHKGRIAGGEVTVVMSPSRNRAVAVLSGLDAPGKGKAYELWLIRGGTAHHAGLLDPGETTATEAVGPLDGATGFAVSLEQAGGSPSGQPTAVKGSVKF